MSTKLYVGGLPESVKEKDLRELFSSFGEVDEIAVFKGYGFVVSDDLSFVSQNASYSLKLSTVKSRSSLVVP